MFELKLRKISNYVAASLHLDNQVIDLGLLSQKELQTFWLELSDATEAAEHYLES